MSNRFVTDTDIAWYEHTGIRVPQRLFRCGMCRYFKYATFLEDTKYSEVGVCQKMFRHFDDADPEKVALDAVVASTSKPPVICIDEDWMHGERVDDMVETALKDFLAREDVD